MGKSSVLTFFCACVPGFGQMYQGYMKRGLSMALWFWGLITVATVLNLGVLTILLPVIWAYAFFDTFNIRHLSPQQRAVFADEYIPNAEWLEKRGVNSSFLKGRGGKIVGGIFIALGIFMIYDNFVRSLLWQLAERLPFLSNFLYNLPTVLVAVAVIALGFWMLGRSRKNQNNTPPEQDDTTPFKGE